jgi:hypothetical protein
MLMIFRSSKLTGIYCRKHWYPCSRYRFKRGWGRALKKKIKHCEPLATRAATGEALFPEESTKVGNQLTWMEEVELLEASITPK